MKPGSHKARKEAAKRLGLKLQKDYRGLVEAVGSDEVSTAAIVLGDTFNSNIEFIINVLKDYGGMEVKFEPMARTNPALLPLPDPDNDTIGGKVIMHDQGDPKLPDISALVNEPVKADCICPPMEPGIIGYKHMTSCPQFVPAG